MNLINTSNYSPTTISDTFSLSRCMKQLVIGLLGLILFTSSFAKSHYQTLTQLPFPENYPSQESIKQLTNELFFQRAVQTYLWALPAMNLYSMRMELEKKLGQGSHILAIWKDRINHHTIIATPNPDVIYAIAWLNLKKDGPTVIEAPPKLQGLIDDAWQRPLTDVGFAGPDLGAGGKYLILPHDYQGDIPKGYFTFKSPTNTVFVFFRAFLEKGQTAPGVALLEKTRIYPLDLRNNPPQMSFPNASNIPMNMDFPRDISYFKNLSNFFNEEPAAAEDFTMRGMAAAIGIIKGKPFYPDEAHKLMLNNAAATAFKMARVMAYIDIPAFRMYPNLKWRKGFATGNALFKADSYTNLDDQIAFFHNAYSTSPAMAVAMPGKGAQYLGGFYDANGEFLQGGNTYRLHIPPNVPVNNYWSIVIYDADTRALVNNGQAFPSVASNTNLKKNADGSADLYFGPKQPKNALNWIKTIPGHGWFIAFRLFGPTKAFFDQSWKPEDIVQLMHQ
jgi:hypothetical protein